MDVDLPASPDGSAFAVYCSNSAPVCTITLPSGAKASDFWFKSAVFQLPNAVLFRAASAAHVMHRGSEEIALGHRQIMLLALIEGEVDNVVDGRRQSIRAGDVAIFDHARGYDSTTTAFAMVAIFADRDRLPPVFRLPAAHGAVLPAASGAARLLHRTLAALHELAGELSLAEVISGIDGLFAVTATALTDLLARQRAQAYGPDAALIEKAFAFVDQNLADADLTPQRVGKHLGMSRSSLYRLFEPLGGVHNIVLQRRLDRAAQTLLSARAIRPVWRDIAIQHGFVSYSQFSRAFRTHFGMTPRAFHDLVRRQDRSELLAQAWRAGYLSSRAWVEYLAGHGDPASTLSGAPSDQA
jgi:AraC-like DNA-binding protein